MKTAKDFMIDFYNEFDTYPTDQQVTDWWDDYVAQLEYQVESDHERGE